MLFVFQFAFVDSARRFTLQGRLFKSVTVVVFIGFGACSLVRIPHYRPDTRIEFGRFALKLEWYLAMLSPLIGMARNVSFMKVSRK